MVKEGTWIDTQIRHTRAGLLLTVGARKRQRPLIGDHARSCNLMLRSTEHLERTLDYATSSSLRMLDGAPISGR